MIKKILIALILNGLLFYLVYDAFAGVNFSLQDIFFVMGFVNLVIALSPLGGGKNSKESISGRQGSYITNSSSPTRAGDYRNPSPFSSPNNDTLPRRTSILLVYLVISILFFIAAIIEMLIS